MPVVKSPFEAQHGFKSPGFSVDDQGNVTLKSVTYTVVEETVDVSGDYLLRQAGNAFTIDGIYQAGSTTELQSNPTLTLTRGSSYVFNLFLRVTNQAGQTLGDYSFNLFELAGGTYTLYDQGLKHVSKDGLTEKTGNEAQGQFEGKVTWTIPDNAPATMAFGDSDTDPICTLNIIDPTVTGIGTFSRITSTGNVTAIGEDAVITLSPTGLDSRVNIQPEGGGMISNVSIVSNRFEAGGDVLLNPTDGLVVLAPTGSGAVVIVRPQHTGTIDNMDIGTITPGSVTTDNLVSTGGTINSTVIGNTNPADATFSTGSIIATPSKKTSITNKKYTDSRSVAMAVAFGV
tara:strand:+ start:3587 stop:4618 length:1032 start_codon:yes stop_codon:yes gene_type:complete